MVLVSGASIDGDVAIAGVVLLHGLRR